MSICVSPHHAALCEAGLITHTSDISFVKNPEIQRNGETYFVDQIILTNDKENKDTTGTATKTTEKLTIPGNKVYSFHDLDGLGWGNLL